MTDDRPGFNSLICEACSHWLDPEIDEPCASCIDGTAAAFFPRFVLASAEGSITERLKTRLDERHAKGLATYGVAQPEPWTGPTATLTFALPRDRADLKLALAAVDLRVAISGFGYWLRRLEKDGDWSEAEHALLDRVREAWAEHTEDLPEE